MAIQKIQQLRVCADLKTRLEVVDTQEQEKPAKPDLKVVTDEPVCEGGVCMFTWKPKRPKIA